jgi:hypothetical protein
MKRMEFNPAVDIDAGAYVEDWPLIFSARWF